ncbi:S8 family peptidase [Actinomadura bangladeshensis]|uniref:S8 family peptidase n=1 Tax=Actinomadura bangladeshensis TaxID=453573 RepID=UPI001FB5FD89|nr:S8 family serine peptidase [Actinomadura bangladeshensis]
MAVLTRRRAAAGLLAGALAGSWLVPVQAHADEIRDRQAPVLKTLGMDAAWKITKGRGVTVGVVDSGVDPNQADLRGKVTTGPNMIAEVDRGTTPKRLHGTAMASLIAGHGHGPGGRSGVIGVAPRASILAVRAISEPEDASYRRYRGSQEAKSSVARGIRYAADHGADVINLSLGNEGESLDEREAVAYAIGRGIVVVASAGNDGDKKRLLDEDGFAPYSYPASFPGVIAVAAAEPDHERAPFSNRNYSVLVSAPGDAVVSAGSGSDYVIGGGTSQAAALVSGIAALIRAKYPKMAPALVSQALVQSTGHRPKDGYDPEVGFGEVHAARALAAAATIASAHAGPGEGKPERERFGAAEPGPVQIIDHPGWVTWMIVAILVLGAGGTAGGGALALAFWRGHRRPTDGPADGPAPGPPPGRPQGRGPYGPPPRPPYIAPRDPAPPPPRSAPGGPTLVPPS